MSKDFDFFEPYAEARAAAAEAKAERVFNGTYENFEEALMFLQFIISNHYGMPFFDPYFKDRSLDDLIFEAKLINLSTMPQDKQRAEVVNKNKAEAESIFDDWNEVDNASDMNEDKFDDISKQFMQTDEFKE